jgi:hypothetical protein
VKLLTAMVLVVLASGCIYANVVTPLGYRAATAQEARSEAAPDTEGVACDYVVLVLFAWGDAGYAAAVADARSRAGGGTLSDMRADSTVLNVLGVYQKACTRVTGKLVR